jgi:DNA helicase-2/ATP-dependent DNA helicase PcrA
MAESDLEPRDFGVLYRTNSQSRLVEQALLRRQIPYQLIGGFRFYMRKEIKDLVSYLLLVHNPDDDIALSRCINTPARGVGKKSLEEVGRYATKHRLSMLEACRQCVQFAIISKRAAKAIAQFLKIYDQLCSIVHGPLLDLLEATVDLTGYRDYLATQAEKSTGENDVEGNLDELLAEASEIDSETPPDQSPLEAFLEFAALEAATDKLESSANSVTLMTLHAAKGLEFRHVYLIAVEENILPHSRSKDDPLQLEEERRLLFVGITRAQDQLQLSYAKSRGFSGSGSGVPSSFLLELPRSEMEFIDRTEFAGGFDSSMGFAGDSDVPYDPNVSGSVDWDSEMSQVDSDEEVYVDFDDECQLPPEEIASRLRKRKLSSAATAGIQLASEMSVPSADQWSEISEGCTVRHPHFGLGTVLSVSGTGKKKSATIGFEMDASVRTFRLSHVKLTVETQSG